MSIAAVPAYLGHDFSAASPGMRFGMYLQLWGVNRRSHLLLWTTHDMDYEMRGQNQQEREVKYENKVSALSGAKKLNDNDRQTMRGLLARQRLTFDVSALPEASFRLDALATAPFTTGLGNEHPTENGFAFLNPYGLPYLPGSGVKGVLRQAARELASGQWDEIHGQNCWSDETCYPLLIDDKPVLDSKKQPVVLSMLDVLFGRDTPSGESDHVRGALIFWDVIPQIAPQDRNKPDQISLAVEIMTPHQGHYYQDKPQAGSTSPHESGQPTPISFLTVPPGSGFTFHVTCDLNRLAPDLAREGRWKKLLAAAFEHAFQWLGFGAKTAVGYGAMASEAIRQAKANEIAAQRETERKAEEQRKREQAQANAETWKGARIKFNRANQSLSVEKDNKTAIALAPLGASLLASLPPDTRKKIETNQFVKVTARVSGNDLLEIVP